ncbi:hypothetical protein F5X96DRAFT_662501, partial [Biscogniauxia mediterranea]
MQLPGDSRCFALQMPLRKLLGLRNPPDRRGSDHLQTGYRRECASVRACFHSWTYIHNDTGLRPGNSSLCNPL